MDKTYRILMAVGNIILVTLLITFLLFGFFTTHYFVSGMQMMWELIVGIGSLVISAILVTVFDITVFGILVNEYNKKH